MDATTSAEREHAHQTQERTAAFVHRDDAPITPSATVSVMILCADPVIAAGLSTVLHEERGFQIVSAREPGDFTCDPSPADVVVADYETAQRLANTMASRRSVELSRAGSAGICCTASDFGSSSKPYAPFTEEAWR
jgi:hypothetical protein